MKYQNIFKYIVIIFFCFGTSSCNKSIAKIFPERPNNELSNDPAKDKDASPEFRQGWADGCEAGMGSSSNTFYQMFYDNNKADGYKMMSSGDYRAAWSAAFWYCQRHSYVKAKSSIWGSTFGGYK
jgi:hypothetical protein